MKRKKRYGICILLMVIISVGCTGLNKSSRKHPELATNNHKVGMASPPVIVYKTRGDYFDKVPVILSEDKKHIVSFPAPSDLIIDGVLTYPTILTDGYLLDNRGINQNAAFLKYSYNQYSTEKNIPNPEMLLFEIVDNNPFIEIYQCGYRGNYKNVIAELDSLISSGRIADCKNLLK